jgi:NADH-quinone oxidoreductase subunit L
MYVPLWILAIGAIVTAVLGLPALHGIPEALQDVYGKFTEPVFAPAIEQLKHVKHLPEVAHEGIGPFVFAWVVAAVGTAIGWMLYAGGLRAVPAKLAGTFPGLYRLMVDKFRVDELYEVVVLEPFRLLAYYTWRIVDVFAIDGLMVNGVARAIGFAGSVGRMAQNGDVQRYAAIMAVAAAVILWSVLGAGGH